MCCFLRWVGSKHDVKQRTSAVRWIQDTACAKSRWYGRDVALLLAAVTLTRMLYHYCFHCLAQNCKVPKMNWTARAHSACIGTEFELSILSLALTVLSPIAESYMYIVIHYPCKWYCNLQQLHSFTILFNIDVYCTMCLPAVLVHCVTTH